MSNHLQSRRHDETLPATPEDVLASPSASYWLKDALHAALSRDALDAACDAELLARVLGARADALLAAEVACLGRSAQGGR